MRVKAVAQFLMPIVIRYRCEIMAMVSLNGILPKFISKVLNHGVVDWGRKLLTNTLTHQKIATKVKENTLRN